MKYDLNYCKKCGSQMIIHDRTIRYTSIDGQPIYEGKLTCSYRLKYPILGVLKGHDSFNFVFFDFADYVVIE